MKDFDMIDSIDIRYCTDKWGPFDVKMDKQLPPDTTITDVSIRAFVGEVTPSTDISELTDVAGMIIDPARITKDRRQFSFMVQYSEALSGKDLTLIFEIEISTGGKHPFYYYGVRVR